MHSRRESQLDRVSYSKTKQAMARSRLVLGELSACSLYTIIDENASDAHKLCRLPRRANQELCKACRSRRRCMSCSVPLDIPRRQAETTKKPWRPEDPTRTNRPEYVAIATIHIKSPSCKLVLWILFTWRSRRQAHLPRSPQ